MSAKRRCVACLSEGINTGRPAPYGGPRSALCSTHNRIRKSQRRSTSQEQRWMALYGITADEYSRIKAFQGGVCALCQRANGARKALSVDHDHATGVVRGCLCLPCNRNVLGQARDSIEFFERCIEYLKNPPAVQAIGIRITPDVATTSEGIK